MIRTGIVSLTLCYSTMTGAIVAWSGRDPSSADHRPVIAPSPASALIEAGSHPRMSYFYSFFTNPQRVWPSTDLSLVHDVRMNGHSHAPGTERFTSQQDSAPRQFTPRPLSPFARQQAQGYLRDRYPCLGCHQLNGEGGRIGPDLSGVGARRSPDYILRMIRDPQATVPGTVMPPMPMPADRAELLASYLAAADAQGRPGDTPVLGPAAGSARPVEGTGAELYARYCASCHGASGNGDGFNAEFLPVPPTRHADSSAMSLRPDDTLFDGIHAGGYILGRSHRMPAFGRMFSTRQIRSLVAHIRRLCRCEQPAWARN